MESGPRRHLAGKPHKVILLLIGFFLCTEVTSSNHVVRRSDDNNELEVTVSRLSEEFNKLTAEVQALRNIVERRTAFLVNTSPQVLNVSANAPILFKGIVLNLDQSYDPTLGVFTAPYSGIYILSFQISPYLATDLFVDLVKSGTVILRTRVYDQSVETSEATSLTLHAAQGDRFWLKLSHSVMLHSAQYCFFSGALVSPDV